MKPVHVVSGLFILSLCVACKQEASDTTPKSPPDGGAAVSLEPSRTELRDEDLSITFVKDLERSLPTNLEADPAGALRPSWQLIKPSIEGALTHKERSDLNFGFCATFKERRWFARCEGDTTPSLATFSWSRSKEGDAWKVIIGGTVELVDWRGETSQMTLRSRYKVEPRPEDLSPELWWRNAARALTVDWVARVDTARREAQSKTMRLHWSEFRRDPPLFKAPKDALWEPIFLGDQAWIATVDAVKGQMLIHHFTQDGVPIAQVLQIAKGAPMRPMLSVDEAQKRVLVTSTDLRELDPLVDKRYKLSGNCEGKGLDCYGITVMSFDLQGKVGIRARILERRALAPSVSLPGEEQLLVAQDAKGKVELIHLLRGGLEKTRHAMAGLTAPSTRISARFKDGFVTLGPLVRGGQHGWVSLESGRKGAKPIFHKVAAAEAAQGHLLTSDGEGGALMLTQNQGVWSLHRHKGKSGMAWSVTVSLPEGTTEAEVSRVGQRIMVRPIANPDTRRRQCVKDCGPQGAIWFELSSGAVLATWDDVVLSPPVVAGEGVAVCRQAPGELPRIEITRDLKTASQAHFVPWGCEALRVEQETGDVRAVSAWPGGAYFVDMP